MKCNKNIILIGMPGCGKTTLGNLLSQRLTIEFCDVDDYIEKKYNTTITQIFTKGEDFFRDIESNAVKEVSLTPPKIISTGGGVVKIHKNIEVLKANGIIFFINRPLENIISDIDTNARPLLSSKKERLYELFEERHSLYKKYCDYEIINDKTLDCVLNDIENILKSIIY